MNKADNDASTRAIDSLINYEVSISFTNTNYFNWFMLILSSIWLSLWDWFFSFIVLQTVKYFNNEVHETDHYDMYLKSK